jgi:hypothetical protein
MDRDKNTEITKDLLEIKQKPLKKRLPQLLQAFGQPLIKFSLFF